MNYEELLNTADQLDLAVKEQPLTVHDGLIRGRRIAIRKSIETQKSPAFSPKNLDTILQALEIF